MSALLHDKTSTRIISDEHERVGLWMQARSAGHYRQGNICIGLERRGELVAGTMYDLYNGASVFAHVAIEGPITRDWLWSICAYPFLYLRVKVVLGTIASTNHASQRFAEHFGFRRLCAVPGGSMTGDLLLYALDERDCRWIRSRQHG